MTTVTQQDAGRRSRRPSVILWVLVGLVATAVVVGAVAGALREPLQLDPGSPESVVQDYLQAVLDGDHAAAVGYLSVGTARRCGVSDFRHAWVPESTTATLDGVTTRGDEADVRVRLRSVAGPAPFGSDDYASLETFRLHREDGHWRITDAPWPVYDCRSLP